MRRLILVVMACLLAFQMPATAQQTPPPSNQCGQNPDDDDCGWGPGAIALTAAAAAALGGLLYVALKNGKYKCSDGSEVDHANECPKPVSP